jgi:periplasmic copper chaperone A
MRSLWFSTVVTGLFLSSVADAHVEVASGLAIANTNSKVTFAIAHGCTDTGGHRLDTISVTIDIPAGVTAVRALPSDFGKPSATLDASSNVTSITWTKPAADLQDSDFQWYEFTLHARMPDAAFKGIAFSVTQTCQDKQGNQTVVAWDQPAGATTGSPAPIVKLVPAHRSGWNKLVLSATTTLQMADLPAYFGDAQIVWRGNAAYSPSADVMAMIATTPGVSMLAAPLMPGDELWVRY